LDETCDIILNGFDENKDYKYVSSGIMEMAMWLESGELLRPLDIPFRT
jgi:hypothetical protein